MKKIIFLLLIVLSFISCNNKEVKKDPGTIIVPLPLKAEYTSPEELEETLKNKTVRVEKVTKKKFIRKKVIEAPYTEYIFK
ncbi:hypothetical protein LH398_12250 [Fusobacterium nucleatum]|jgi:hypothetical protein